MRVKRSDTKARRWSLSILTIMLSVALVLTMMPVSGIGRVYAEQETDASTDGSTTFVQPAKAFMDPPEQLNKPSEVDGTNWMSAIPGERRITEINVPYAHDSATKQIDTGRVLVDLPVIGSTTANLLKQVGWRYAQTQRMTIPDQLNYGVRVLDVRMNNVGPNGLVFEDDGENLWVCHGRKKTGTYYARNDEYTNNGYTIVSVAQVLGEVKTFLTEHPTETVTILFTVESQEYSKVHDKCFKRLRSHLQKLADEENPSTGKPYLYREEGRDFFQSYLHIPKLKDCRGQLVIQYDSDDGAEDIIGGMYGMGGIGDTMPDYDVKIMREPGNNSVLADKKIKNLHLFMDNEENWHPIPRSVTPHLDHFYFMSLATHTEAIEDYINQENTPLEMAKEINQEFFDKEDAFFKQNGVYFGWVKMDGIIPSYAGRIWRSNFTGDDYLDYCTVTVKSGLDDTLYPVQKYTVIKGTPITLPECIYDYDPETDGKFDGWQLQDSSGSKVKQPGGSFNADSDVTVTASWNKQVKDEVMVKLVPGTDGVVLPEGYDFAGDPPWLFKAPYDQKFGNLGLDQASCSGYELDGWYNSKGVKMTDTRRLKGDVFDIKNGEYATIVGDDGFSYYLITLTARWSKHPMRTPQYSWADDLSTCTATRHCTQEGCTECLETETVNSVQTVVTESGCIDKGQTIYTAEFENPAFTTQKKERFSKQLGHDWGEPVYEWSENNTTVTATRSCERDSTHQQSEIVETTSEVTKQPTESEEGETTYTATFQNDAFATQTKTVTNIPELGHEHEWGEPTYTWSDDGSIVVAKRVCSKDPSHVEQESVLALRKTTKEASCKEAGAYTCTAKFENEAFETQTRDFEEPKLGCEVLRISILENVVEPTCTEMGSQDAVFYCLVCGGEWERTEMKTAALGHRWGAWTQTKAPTCSVKGEKERVCKNDSSHKDIGEVAIDPDAHDWDEWVVTKEATETEDGVETRNCKNDASHTETRSISAKGHEHHLTKVDAVDANCTEDGNIEYWKCDQGDHACGKFFSDEEGRTEVTEDGTIINAIGHDWGGWTITKEATETEEGLQTRTCKNDESHVEELVIPKKDHEHNLTHVDGTSASCTASGTKDHYECSGCQALFEDAEGEVLTSMEGLRIPATGHKLSDPEKSKETLATCSSVGGYNLTTKCSNCGRVLKVERVVFDVDPDAHDWGDWTRLNDDQHQRVCANDSKHVEKAKHSWDAGKVTKEATATAEGEKTYTCEVCGTTKTEPIDKLSPEPAPTPTPQTDPVGPGASKEDADKAITNMTTDTDPKGSVFSKLNLKSPKQTKNSVQLKWTKLGKAKKYIIYGNKCGKTTKPKKLAEVTSTSKTFKKVAGKRLKKGTYYKFIIVAIDKDNKVVSTSKLIHVATKGGKVGNHKTVTVKKSVITRAKKLKKGKSLKLRAKAVKQSAKLKVRKHVGIRYESTNPKIATVSKKGVVRAKMKGSCYIYAYAQDGVFKKIKVMVK